MKLTQIILYGTDEQLALALEEKPELNELDAFGYSPLIECAIKNDTGKAKLILEAGADVNQHDMSGRSALHWAVANNNLELTNALLEHKADANSYTISSEPVLARAVLSENTDLRKLLIKYGADPTFANDYINTKLLGHRYELIGSADIVDTKGIFTEVDYEGFYLEFSFALINSSLEHFRQHYIAKNLHQWFQYLDAILMALHYGNRLLSFDNYLIEYEQHRTEISKLLKNNSIVIPFSQQGHAFTVVRHGNLLAICDRAKEDGAEHPDQIEICFMNRPSRLQSPELISMIYERQHIKGLKNWFQMNCQLQPIINLPLPAQRIGNCSWANSEAAIPVLFLMMQITDPNVEKDKSKLIEDALELHFRWRRWDRQRALHFMISQMPTADEKRRASIASILAGVLFQSCDAENEFDLPRAKRIIGVIKKYNMQKLFDTYFKFYAQTRSTAAGKNLQRLIAIYERDEEY